MSIEHDGPCKQRRCEANADCADDTLFCDKETGDCDATGICATRPEACPEIFAPVCGCDGKTYDNACFANAAGVTIARDGACETRKCETNDDCPRATFCQKDSGDCDGVGECRDLPQLCPLVVRPVCGCDGETYGNSCEAFRRGINVAHEGPCLEGCTTNAHCDEKDFCDKDGDCDGLGKCEPRPLGCPDVFDPVCGCDGNTYGNDCEAKAAGVSVVHKGRCPSRCKSNDDCDDASFCSKPDGDCEANGECLPRPEVCVDVVDPVCGCDGKTYRNSCEAAAAGVTLLHDGACEEDIIDR